MDTTSVIRFKSPPMPFFIEAIQTEVLQGKSYPARASLGMFNLLYVKKGSLYLVEENKSYTINSGEYIVLRPDTVCIPKKMCTDNTVVEDIQFSTVAAWEEVGVADTPQLYGDYYSHILHVKKKHTISQKKKIEHIIEKLKYASLSGEAEAFWDRQQHFVSLLKFLDEQWRAFDAKASLAVAEKAAAYIKLYYNEHLTNPRLAKELGYHINYIARCMDEIYSMTPQQYLTYYRLDQAKLMLVRTEQTIAQIAAATGFKQTAHFSRLFAYYVGLSPLKYRKKYTV